MKIVTVLKGGAQDCIPCLEGVGGGGAQKSDPRVSHLVAPPFLIINDRPLTPSAHARRRLRLLISSTGNSMTRWFLQSGVSM